MNWKPCWKKPVQVEYREQQEGDWAVSTREGVTPLKPDDLIMRGVRGERYPIGRDIFEATYSLEPPPDIDALRARLAEVEGERDGFRNGQGQVQAMLDDLYKSNDRLGTKLAASQAEARALREALEKFKWAASPEQHGGTSAYPYEDICALLATPPGSDAALREVVMRAVCAGEEWASDSSAYHGCTTAKEAVQIRKDIVDAILGPNATDANEGGGE